MDSGPSGRPVGQYAYPPPPTSSASHHHPVYYRHSSDPSASGGTDHREHHDMNNYMPGQSRPSSGTSQTNYASSNGRDEQAGPSNGVGHASSASALITSAQKSRSAQACLLCRRQKMKCEGPNSAPCRRCKAAGVECVFESPSAPTPRSRPHPGTPPDSWVMDRLSHFEERLNELETVGPAAQTLVGLPSSGDLTASTLASTASDHERRIASLEAQLYALQFAVASSAQTSSPGQLHHRSPLHPIPSAYPATPSYNHDESRLPPPPPSQLQQFPSPASYSASIPEYHHYPVSASARGSYVYRADSGDPMRRAESEFSAGVKREQSVAVAERGVEKRWRSTEEGDFVTRGVITEDEAQLCFDSYFFSFREVSGATGPPIHLPFAATRSASKLLLATIVFIGARSLARTAVSTLVLEEAFILCHSTFLSDIPATSLALKAIILLSLYTGTPNLLAHVVALSWHLETPYALLKYEALSEERKRAHQGRKLLQAGRTFLVSYLWTSYYSTTRGVNGGFDLPGEVLIHQLDILEASEDSRQPTDRTIRVSLIQCLIMKHCYDKIGQGRRTKAANYAETCEVIDKACLELSDWSRRYLDVMELLTVWGDSPSFKAAVPFHHGQLNLMTYIFTFVTDDSARELPKIREYAQRARDSSLVILKWGVESRIWLPHSMSAQYLHYINIPTSLDLLYKCARLFPDDASFPLIRKLLHRLISQCDTQLANQTGYPRELARSKMTKDLAMEFDRFAFEQAGSAESRATHDAEVLFGDDIKASLDALGGELSLFSSILLDALDYDDD